MWPLDAAGEEKNSEPVVLEVAEAMATAFDLLHAEVLALGGPVAGPGAVVVQDLRPPTVERPTQRSDLGYRIFAAAGDRLVEKRRRVLHVIGQVEVSNRLLGQPGTNHLVIGIAETQAQQQALMASLAEAFGTHREQLADAIERVVLAASVAEGLVRTRRRTRSTVRLATRTT